MAIGRPISLTPNIATKNISAEATADQTEFTVTGGYRINEIAVYRNGVRLAEGRDFTASDGNTVTLTQAATVYDLIEFAVYDSFNIADAIIGAASSQTVNGDLNVTGNFYAGSFSPTGLSVGVATVSSSFHVGSALTANAAGDVETVGIITASNLFVGTGVTVYGSTGIVSATTFYGDGSNLEGVVSGVELQLSGTTVGTSVTVLNFGAGISSVTPVSSGISTIETSRILTIGVRTGTAVTFAITGTSFNVSARSGNVAINV